MLVLSRKAGERIRIGNDIEVTITQVKGSRVLVGIEAPRETKVLRTEVEDRDGSSQAGSS